MAENQDLNQDQHNEPENNDNSGNNANTDKDQDLVAKIVQQKVEEQLKEIKNKLDKAYGARDEALKKVAEFEQSKKDAELKRLQEEGKHKEAYELQLAEERAKREALEKRNVELTRDIEVRNALGTLTFRNDKALEMAYHEVVSSLVQNEQGVWVHRSGVSIKDFVKAFSDNEDNAFLFKQKVSTGSGSSGAKPANTSSDSNKSIFSRSQEEVLQLAREGKLRRQ